MIPVYQTIFSRTKGDCLRAAIASIFERKLEEIPEFNPQKWWMDAAKFFHEQGKVIAAVPTTSDAHLRRVAELFQYDCGEWCLVIVESFVFPGMHHAVVGKIIPELGVHVVHDPNPDNADRKWNEYRVQEIIFIY